MRKVEKIVGTPFTRRKTTRIVAETPDEIKCALRQWAESEFFDDPWAGHRLKVEAARAQLALEIAAAPEGYSFKERQDVGWYLKRLIILGDRVQHHIDVGSPEWAAHEAALYGETFCELQMKLAREREWTTGKKVHEGGAASRRGEQAVRVAKIEALCSGSELLSRRQAFKRVAEEEGVTAKAVETDYYKAKKVRPNPRD